ncbi:ABC transporter permease [bacterium]|nr:ABC transporter permease [bacterium]MCB2179278.1 ABC transporter permease [bacterium]
MSLGKIFRKLIKNPSGLIGLLLLIFFAAIAIFSPVIAPAPDTSHDPQMMPKDGNSTTPQVPSEAHPFGTTNLQNDIFYGVVWGTRSAFRVGVGITLITTTMGVIVGSISALYGGWIDDVFMRISDLFQSLPYIMTAIILTSVLQLFYERGEGIMLTASKVLALFTFGHPYNVIMNPIQVRFVSGMIAIIMFGWMAPAKLIRGNVLKELGKEYTLAAQAIGAKKTRILFRHLLPNAIPSILVFVFMNIGTNVLAFATLGFLGVVAQPGYSDWGQMISFARDWIPSLDLYPHIIIYPGIAIALFILAWNLVGDAVRDIIDPRSPKIN